MTYTWVKDIDAQMWKLVVKEKDGNLMDQFYIDPDFNANFVNAVVEHKGELHTTDKDLIYKILFPTARDASDFITEFLEPWITMRKLKGEIIA